MGIGYLIGFMGSQYWMFYNSINENQRQSEAIRRRDEGEGMKENSEEKKNSNIFSGNWYFNIAS